MSVGWSSSSHAPLNVVDSVHYVAGRSNANMSWIFLEIPPGNLLEICSVKFVDTLRCCSVVVFLFVLKLPDSQLNNQVWCWSKWLSVGIAAVGMDSQYFDCYDPPSDVTLVDLDTNSITVYVQLLMLFDSLIHDYNPGWCLRSLWW